MRTLNKPFEQINMEQLILHLQLRIADRRP
jgi:hypothetical protein